MNCRIALSRITDPILPGTRTIVAPEVDVIVEWRAPG